MGEHVMKKSLINYVVCPVDGSWLRLENAVYDGEEVQEGSLTCESGHVYLITKGVPRLAGQQTGESANAATRDCFSSKWQKIPTFGFEPRSREFYINWYLQRYGLGGIEGLQRSLHSKKMVLDAGTGLGRDAMLYGENSTGEVFAVDISRSIDLAYKHVGHLSNVHVLEADLNRLPFRKACFDYIGADGVIHHTPDTAVSFRNLTRHLAEGGQIAVYVYKEKGPIREFCDNLLREYYTKSSEEECLEFSRAMTALGKSLSDLNMDFLVPEDIPILKIQAGTYNLQRFIYYNIFKCYWNEELDFDTNMMTNFDWYRPAYAHRHTPEQVKRWCELEGLNILHFDVIDSGISVRAERPGRKK